MKPKLRVKKPPAPASKSVLIVDDHPFLRAGLTESIEAEPGLSVCCAFATAEEALAAVGKLRPDVVIADLNLPGKSGLELIKELGTLRPGLPVIVLSMHDEGIYAERCLRAGARGYVMKNEGPERLIAAIRQVLAGGVHVSGKVSAHILSNFSGQRDSSHQAPLGRLTEREFEVFRLIADGLSTAEIAEQLKVGTKTIETHRVNIKTKLGLRTLPELIAFAARWVAADA